MKSRTPKSRFTRRQFLQTTALAGVAAPFVLPSGLRGATANGKLNHACIGVGGMGWNDLNTFLKHPRLQVVALCDVDANHLAKAQQAVPGGAVLRGLARVVGQGG